MEKYTLQFMSLYILDIYFFPFYQHTFHLTAQFEVWFMFVADMRQGKLRTLCLMLD